MAIVKCKPTSAGRRHVVKIVNPELYKGKPYAPLLDTKSKTGGRNNYGRITTRHIGGGHKQHYRLIDFKRNKLDIPAVVERLEYDPNRSAFIALVQYEDGEKRYIIAPEGLKVGDTVMSGAEADIKPGNCLPIANIPLGTLIHNIEIKVGKGGQMVRSAGTAAQVMAKEGDYAQIRLPSGEVRKVSMKARATVGQVGNTDHSNVRIGKAGRSRHMGIRPSVRGVVMNPCDHPHGGGEGRSPVGMPAPMSPWGKKTQGVKTRKHRKYSDKMIVSRASKKK